MYFVLNWFKIENRQGNSVIVAFIQHLPGHGVMVNMRALGARDSRFESECPDHTILSGFFDEKEGSLPACAEASAGRRAAGAAMEFAPPVEDGRDSQKSL